MSDDKAIKIIKDYDQCASDRLNWESQWRNIGKYIIPFKDDIFQTNQPGQKKGHDISDATGVLANDFLASALHSMLTNPSTQWFQYSAGDYRLDYRDDVRKYFQDCTLQAHDILTNSNFHVEIHEVYLDLGSFGTGIMLMEEDDEEVIRFRSCPVYTTYIKENYKGVVDTIYRCYKMTADNIIELYGTEAFPAGTNIEAILKDSSKKYEIIHAVYPRNDRMYGVITPTNMPWASTTIFKEYKKTLKDSGYTSFPYVAPRWSKISNEQYGRSPGMKALPDIMMLDSMKRITLRGAEKIVDPPIQAPDEGISLPIKLTPGGVNYYRAGTEDRLEQMDIKSRIDFGYQVLEDIRNSIKSAFFLDRLQLQDGPQKTAEEVRQRTDENLRVLGPILGRQENELLKPMTERLFDICSKKKLFPTPPDILKDKGYRVQYSSMMARSQKTAEVENLTRFFSIAAPLLSADPTVIDNVNLDEAILYSAKKYNVPEEIIRDVDERDQLRQARAQQAQQMQQQQAEAHAADVVQKTSNA